MRRKELHRTLQIKSEPITGSELAARFGVSRQVIVQDIAVLRAEGIPILSTPKGYLLDKQREEGWPTDVLAVRHTSEKTAVELYTAVDLGVSVLDVIVEHPIYGELRGDLMLESRSDVAHFLDRLEKESATLLSSLTEGRHWHTVRARRADRIEKLKQALDDLGILENNP